MKKQFMPYRVLEVDFIEPVSDIHLEKAALIDMDGNSARFRFNRFDTSASELIVALAKQYKVKDIRVEEPEIETIVREIYQRPKDIPH